MNKRHCILCMFVCVMLCACQGGTSEQESAHGGTEQSERPETGSAGSDTAFLEKYEQVFAEMNGGRTALLYLDDDSVPELLLLKDGEYQLYFFDGSEAKNIPLPGAGMKANAYGTRYSIENTEEEELTFFRFEYVPRKGLVRIHDGDSEKRRDCYLSYEGGVLSLELETDDEGHTWNTYDAEGEITNEEFSDRLAKMGYDNLTCCAYLYGDVKTAYENMGRVSDTRKALEDFVNGKTDAVEYVESRCEVPEEGFAGRSFAAINEELTAGEPWWEGLEYVDFDNDGEDELIMHGYTGARLYLDVVGDTVYKVLKTSSTTDVSYAAEMEGKRVVVRTDLTHGGRQYYWVMTYDGCGCLTDWFRLSAGYEGADYGVGDSFEYRDRAISMEEFETIRDSIHDLNKEDQHSNIPLVYWDIMDQYKQIPEADIDDVGQDAWGLDGLMELFDIWEWRPSNNPTSLVEIADMAGYSQEYMEEQMGNAEKALMMLPKVKVGDTVISFCTEESEKQFFSIEWNDYVFKEAKTKIFSSDSQGLWGHTYLCNSLQEQMGNKPAVFVIFYYQFEAQRLEIMEVIETSQEIIDYACILDYEDDGQRVFMRKEEGIRLLNPAAELNPYENVLPLPGLKGKELERYIALVFLNIVRDTYNLDKYEKVLSDESFSLFRQLDCYYEKPGEIYDFVKFWENGNITITSQFQPTLWGSILIDIDIWFVYDVETGMISVEEGQFRLSEKP